MRNEDKYELIISEDTILAARNGWAVDIREIPFDEALGVFVKWYIGSENELFLGA